MAINEIGLLVIITIKKDCDNSYESSNFSQKNHADKFGPFIFIIFNKMNDFDCRLHSCPLV